MLLLSVISLSIPWYYHSYIHGNSFVKLVRILAETEGFELDTGACPTGPDRVHVGCGWMSGLNEGCLGQELGIAPVDAMGAGVCSWLFG